MNGGIRSDLIVYKHFINGPNIDVLLFWTCEAVCKRNLCKSCIDYFSPLTTTYFLKPWPVSSSACNLPRYYYLNWCLKNLLSSFNPFVYFADKQFFSFQFDMLILNLQFFVSNFFKPRLDHLLSLFVLYQSYK